MKEIILVKNGELVLKGLNRSSFEDVLIKNMRRHLEDLGEFKFTKSQSTVMVEAPDEDTDWTTPPKGLKRFSALRRFQEPPCAKRICKA